MPDKQTVRIVIPVKNEAIGLKTLLCGVLNQSYSADEVMVVDAGSTDGTQDILARLAQKEPRLRTVECPGAFPGKARNRGIAGASADIIVQIDGGCTVAEKWLEALAKPLQNGEADYVTGSIQPMPVERKILGEVIDMGAVFSACTNPVARSEKTIAGGASAAYRRTLWEKVGGHPGWLRCGSDALFAHKIGRLGIRHAYAPESIAYWQVGPRLRDVLSRAIRYATVNAQLGALSLHGSGHIWKPLLFCALVLLGLWWSWAFLGLFVVLLAVWGKRTLQSLGRYFQRNEEVHGHRRRVVLLLIALTHLGLIGSKQLGTMIGTWKRLTRKADNARLRDYLTK